MELSPLLVVGIVLLVAVVGLSFWQRPQVVDRTAGDRTSGGPPRTPPARHADGAVRAESQFAFAKDDLLGVISYDEGIWTADDEMAFVDSTVIVEVHGHKSGLTEAQSELVRLALKYPRDLDGRAREVIAPELGRQDLEGATITPYELTVRPGDDGRDVGFLWYEVEGTGRDIGVSSADGWKTLTLQTDEVA